MRNLWIAAALIAGAATLCTTGCSQQDRQTAKDQAKQALNQAERIGSEAMQKAGQMAGKAKTKLAEEFDKMSAAANDSATASATLQPASGSTVAGTVRFTKVGNNLDVDAKASGMTPGKHGFHLHQIGNCGAADASSAGGHLKLPGDTASDIAGNLGEFTVGDDGKGAVQTTLKGVSLPLVKGRAVVVHAKGNDPSQPPGGAAGKRIACGVIK